MTPIINYLKLEMLPADKKEAKRLVREAQYYTIIQDVLYRKGISTPLLKCVLTFATKEVLEEVHSGMCGNHLGARALAKKVLRAGLYWPTLQREATKFVKTCPPWQKHANFHIAPPKELICITSPWIHKMGARPPCTLPPGFQTSQVPHRRHRLLHKVD
ncbi:uncharacterized protein [Arachis hypogaea]|uniref:uncharacterized protein n=1 Tax=Arachis hypogaea TaxID=3818 RepID=UPI003B215030